MVWKENGENAYCEITPAILALKEQWEKKNYIDPKLYKEYNVKRGLRDEDGRGVLTGLTRVGEIQSYSVTEGEHIIPQDGVLYYRGESLPVIIPPAMRVVHLKAADFGKGVITHSPYAEEIHFAEGTTSIGSDAVEDCPNLKTVYVPEGAEVAPDAFPESVEVKGF